jgi:chloride channel protein, CIC family
MAHGHYEKLGAEEVALHDSWDSVLRISLMVALIAVLVWLMCTALRGLVHWSTELLYHAITDYGWQGGLLFMGLLLFGGVLRGLLIRRYGWGDAAGDGMSEALQNYHVTYEHEGDDPQPRYERPAFGLALKKAAMTLLTLGTGGSGGLEAPVVLISECIGAGWGRVMRTASEHELRTYQLAAIGAGVSSLLGAPFTAALFATEIAYSDRIVYRKFAYALFAGIIAYILNNHVAGIEPLFVASPHDRVYSLEEYGLVAMVAVVVSAPIALGFGMVLTQARSVVERFHTVSYGALGPLGVGLVALGLFYGVGMDPRHVLGVGEHTIHQLLELGSGHGHVEAGEAARLGTWWFLLLAIVGRMLTTGLTIQSGGSAGLLIPSMFLGGVGGAASAEIIKVLGLFPDADVTIFVVAGIASSLVAVVGVPLASIALVLEIFGPQYGPPAILACGVTYVLTLRFTVYASQRRSPTPLGDEVGGEEPADGL